MSFIRRNEPLVASALILVAVVCGWLAMPGIMYMISDGGPVVGAAVAILFMLAFFGVLWLRARWQRRFDKE
jgi:drug/metabolite transporter (DMT)-like permease